MIYSVIIHEQNKEPIQWCFDNIVLQHDFAGQMMKYMYKVLNLKWNVFDRTPVNNVEELQAFLSEKEVLLNHTLELNKSNPITFTVTQSKLYTRDNYLSIQADFLGDKK